MSRAGVEAEVEATVKRYIALSEGMCFSQKREFWDLEEPRPLLAPEEVAKPLVGWPAIDAYWGQTRGSLQSLRTECWDIVVTRLSGSEVLALFKQRWMAQLKGQGLFASAPMASTVRVSMGLRWRDPNWKIFVSVESHVDGLEYFRSVLMRRALTLSSS